MTIRINHLTFQSYFLILTPILVHSEECQRFLKNTWESHFHFFRGNNGIWSLQKSLHRPDRHGSKQEPHPHPRSALQVLPLLYCLISESDLLWLETERFISSKNLRALAKMPADFPYRFNFTASRFFPLLHVALVQ